MNQRKVDVIAGWGVFSISLLVYFHTLEPSVSFWDCGEFIACSSKLQIGHQPGAPFFLLLGRIFSMAAGNNTGNVALMINAMSAIASAFTVMFLFKTILMLFSRLQRNSNSGLSETMLMYAGAISGSMIFAFSDTFWFSAVEAEVYALSSLFTAIVFWCMLKWAKEESPDRADRWLILIAYLMGLSIGVHLLNLLAIPALVTVYYFTKKKPQASGFMISLLFSFVLLGSVVFLIIPGIIRLAAWADLLFVNSFGLPVNSGALFYIFSLIVAILFLIRYSHRHEKFRLNKVIIAAAVFLIGYSSYMILPIRAAANPPINLNKVNNAFSLLQYVGREQYVSRPLIYGPYFNSKVTGYKERYTWVPQDGKYIKKQINGKYLYKKDNMTLFPRMSGFEKQDEEGYRKWAQLKGKSPGFVDNLRYFFRYQAGYMYWRYFLWNFAGRQSATQGTGDVLNGNWISGIPFIDSVRLGSQDNLPEYMKMDKGRNVYYFLPLILGLAGFIFHFRHNKNDFITVLLFFLLTGLAIVVYLNEIPVTPRERDYAVGGSFYVFCIWVGFGPMAIARWMTRFIPDNIAAYFSSAFVLLIPVLMAAQNYDDHDRSGRYFANDVAWNYLNSCEKNAILFTNADNDTYPLWYAQETEGVRTDVRVVLTPFLSADWYIEKLADWQNTAAPVSLNIDYRKYASGELNYVPYYKRTDNPAPLFQLLQFIGSNDPRAMIKTRGDSPVNYYPTNKILIRSNPGDDSAIKFNINETALMKHQIAALDIIAANIDKRPIYFLSLQVPTELGLSEYLELDGFAYKLVPEKFQYEGSLNAGRINSSKLYEKLMHTFRWGNMNEPDVFMDDNCIRTTSVLGIRNVFARLGEQLVQEGQTEKAVQVLDRCMELMPDKAVPYDYFVLRIIAAYINAGGKEQAEQLIGNYRKKLDQEMKYYRSLNNKAADSLQQEISYTQFVIRQIDALEESIDSTKG